MGLPCNFPPDGAALECDAIPWGEVDGWVLYVPGPSRLIWGRYGQDPLGWRP